MSRDAKWILGIASLASGILIGAAAAHAVDGVIEINHACATSAAGCAGTGGDSGGYPVTIGRPGSYRLTSNLTVPVNTGGIEIGAVTGSVIIDLNGFEIAGPATCSGCPVAGCSGGGSERGIFNSTAALVSIRNGAIDGMGAFGIDLVGGAELDHVAVTNSGQGGAKILGGGAAITRTGFFRNGGDGLFVDPGFSSNVTGSKASCNLSDGFDLGSGSTVTENTAEANGAFGLRVAGGSTISANTARFNVGGGIRAVDSSVIGNAAQGNAGDGIFVFGGSTVSANTTQNNGGIGIDCLDGVTVSTNTIRGNGSFGLNVGNGSGYFANVLTCNNSGGVCLDNPQVSGPGINIGSNLCGTDTICP